MNNHLVRYIIVGVMTTIVNIFFFYITNTVFHYLIANTIAWLAAVIFAFFANRKYVFTSDNHHLSLFKQAISFFSMRAVSLLVDTGLMILLITYLSIDANISKILTNFFIVFINYGFSKYIIFKEKPNE